MDGDDSFSLNHFVFMALLLHGDYLSMSVSKRFCEDAVGDPCSKAEPEPGSKGSAERWVEDAPWGLGRESVRTQFRIYWTAPTELVVVF